MRGQIPTPSLARFVLVSITAAAVFYAPTAAIAGPVNATADSRAAFQRVMSVQSGGGAGQSAGPSTTSSAGSQAGVLAAQARAQLTRHQELRQSFQSLQAAARAAAQAAAAGVPDGLTTGGLQVATGATSGGPLWIGALLPVQQAGADGKKIVTVKQTDAQSLLTWNTFNIGRNTKLKFDQSLGGASQGEWVAFNKIVDPTGNPTRILGAIEAPGQVYVINPNGIIFGGTAQVNTRTLVASALPLNESLVSRGLLNNPDTQFLFTGLAVAGGAETNAFTPPAPVRADGHYGDVLVEAGAILNSPTNADKSGGRIALIGANVRNAGTISTPDGQTILAAGLQVGLEAHAGSDPSLRGLDVHVGQVGDYAGAVSNTGMIDARRGAITLVGKTIAQEGLVGSTTSVSRNGRIDVLAQYNAVGSGGFSGLPSFFSKSTGTVTFGENSVTEILPELASTEKAVGTKLALKSTLNVRGLALHLEEDASILAPSAIVNFDAGRWNLRSEGTAQAQADFVYTGGQIYFDKGASLNVAGTTGVTASAADNIISVSLRGDELANSPLQRDGLLRGQTIKVDILQAGTYNGTSWVGTPLADVTGYVNLVERNIGQLTADGGTVKLNAGGSVVIRSGASIDVSGGYVNYEGANVETTKVRYKGAFYDISKATPDLVYDGIYNGIFTPDTNTGKWGSAAADSQSSLNRLFTQSYLPGFIQGGGAGTVTITAPSMALDGKVTGRSVSGVRQRAIPALSGGLGLNFQGDYADAGSPTGFFTDSRTPPTVRISSSGSLGDPADFALDADGVPLALNAERTATVILSPELVSKFGIGRLSVNNTEGDVTVAADGDIELPALGELTLAGKNVDVAGDITAPGGKVTLTANAVSRGAINNTVATPGFSPPPEAGRGHVRIAAGANVSTAGLIENDAVGTVEDSTVTSGGAITVTGYDVDLQAGAVLDVSGGVYAAAGARPSYGQGGTLGVLSGQDASVKSAIGGQLVLDAKLRGYSGSKGGTLVLQAPAIQVGEGTPAAGATVLQTEFFEQGGFASFDIRGLGGVANPVTDSFTPGVRITAGTLIKPVADSYVAVADDAAPEKFALETRRLDEGRRAAASIAFSAPGVRDSFSGGNPLVIRGDLVVEGGATIKTDAGAKISLTGDTVNVAGRLVAHGGSINLKGAGNSNTVFPFTNGDQAVATVTLGSSAMLDASGTAVLQPDVTGRDLRTGTVLAGGSVSLAGNIRAAAGSLIDVSGASATLDLDPVYSGGSGGMTGYNQVATRVDSSGGTLTLAGSQQLITAATLRGGAGGASAEGGKLFVSSGIYQPVAAGSQLTPADVNLVVTQTVAAAPDTTRGNFAADSFNGSGFDSLSLAGTVRFSGPVSLVAPRELRVADGGVLHGDSTVSLSAARVSIGMDLQKPRLAGEDNLRAFYLDGQPYAIAPVHGAGQLKVNASQLIDVGNLTLQGFGSADLQAVRGDIRGSGTFDVAGDLSLRAGQIYPATATTFSLHAYDYQDSNGVTRSGSITVRAGEATPALPFSAGGTLNLHASTIVQNGTLRAPFGIINLGWNGTGPAPVDLITGLAVPVAQQVTLGSSGVTSVSAVDPKNGQALTLPYGAYVNGSSWVDPQGRDISNSGTPAKQVVISAGSVVTKEGSVVDLNGGGDLLAARFKTGTGGKVDILASSGGFAVIPSYEAGYAPFAPFNDTVNGRALLGTDAGYVNSSLAVGDRIYLSAGSGLAAGYYTLLPARYALLPGAYLVTPKSGAPLASAAPQVDRATYVSGYRFNSTGGAPDAAPLRSLFEVASSAVLKNRATYEAPLANAFFRAGATARGATVPRLPVDAGQLVFAATNEMDLRGGLEAKAGNGGLGGQVDISSPVDIRIVGSGATATPGELLLDASRLSAFNGASLLIGGSRRTTSEGTLVTVSSDNITVDNAGTPLVGAEIILSAKENLTVATGAEIRQSGTLGGAAQALVLGDSAVTGSGDGALLRVTSDAAATVARAGVRSTSTATLTIADGSTVRGGAALILDSTGSSGISDTADFSAQSLTLNSGRISLQLENPGALEANPGLVLTGGVLSGLQDSSRRLSLLSYSTIDIYGTGNVGSASFEKLTFSAPEIRGFNNGGGTATFQARTIQLDGGVGGTAPAAVAADAGTLAFDARIVRVDAGRLAVGQYAHLQLNASDRLLFAGEGGLLASGDVTVRAPLVTAETAAVQSLAAGGSLRLEGDASSAATTAVGARLSLSGDDGVAVDTAVRLHSGRLAVQSSAGDVIIGAGSDAHLDVSGVTVKLQNVVKYTGGGALELTSGAGDVILAGDGTLSVSAPQAGGNAGALTVSAVNGSFTADGSVLGRAGRGGEGGRFSSDVGALAGGSLETLDTVLNDGGFDAGRTHRVRTGDVRIDGTVTSRAYEVSADDGSITVAGTIDASGVTGGSINLSARNDLVVADGARLDASGDKFNNAGKGGAIKLGAGASRNGVANTAAGLTLEDGAVIDLSVAAADPSVDAAQGRATGTLHLRAPRTVAGTDLAIGSLEADIVDASAIVLEGFKVRDLTPGSGTSATITSTVRNSVLSEAATFGNATAAILARVTGEADAGVLHVQPGIEIVNRTGDLVLDGIWDLSTARYGPSSVYVERDPGILTLRAAGNLDFRYSSGASASLSDGFGTGTTAITTTTNLWNAPLLAAGSRSWSYNLAAGSDLAAARVLEVQAADPLAPAAGSFIVGNNAPNFDASIATRQAANGVPRYYQVIRTGTGDISVAARGNVEFRNNLAALYTAGTQAEAIADFDTPNTSYRSTALGAVQYAGTAPYAAQYSLSGGDISVFAQNDIARTLLGQPDSSKQMPNNWLYRRGNVDSETGEFDTITNSPSGRPGTAGERTSTTWWIDFNNFFEGIGALGGGNVTLVAGADVSNVDAVAPTNARMPAGRPDSSKLVELGGGDVTVRAGGDIDGGVYYVERGRGTLTAGGDITTNYTRTTERIADAPSPQLTAPSTWLPTTLFVGKGSFDLSAGGDLTLGAVANPFLLPGGINNSYFLKSYFSTYSADSSVEAFALTGDLSLRSRSGGGGGSLYDWFNNVLRLNSSSNASTLAGRNQPWLRLYEGNITPFATFFTLLPGNIDAVAATGDVNLVGEFNILPSARGGLELIAGGSVNGLQVVGRGSNGFDVWAGAIINFSDTDPSRLPDVAAPRAIAIPDPLVSASGALTTQIVTNAQVRNLELFTPLAELFAESGSYTGDVYGRLQTKQNLHAEHSVHAGSADPVRIIAGSGDVSGFTLYSAKATEVRAGRDISDVGLYLQNLDADDTSVVAAGRDILLYNPSSALRTRATSAGNTLLNTSILFPGPGTGNPAAGDLQIGGPGSLLIQAGRNMDMGSLPDVSPGDGTAVGLTSIGNARNLYLPDGGADVSIGVGLGDGSAMNRPAFDAAFLDPASAGANAARYLPVLAELLGLRGADDADVWDAYSNFPDGDRARFALAMFNRVLRDAGRDHNDTKAAGFGTYDAGFAAIKALFPGSSWDGDLRLSSRELRTSAGGDIVIYAPGGGVNLGSELSASQTPPGIITERGGDISIFSRNDVDIGTQRIFTLRGGDILIWSSAGNIAAGSSATTLQSASPTRVVVDPQSGDVQTDLAGLATGGGIGVLAAVKGVPPGDVDLIAPVGTIDAGDAGIRSAGNINISALTVLNAANISAGGVTSGAPAIAAPNIGGLSVAASASAAAGASGQDVAAQAGRSAGPVAELPSLVTIEVLGYGGGDEEKKPEPPVDGV